VAAITTTFLKCGSFKKLNGHETVLAGKMAVLWQFKNLLSKTGIQEQVGFNLCEFSGGVRYF
jgi:hypothetical protein